METHWNLSNKKWKFIKIKISKNGNLLKFKCPKWDFFEIKVSSIKIPLSLNFQFWKFIKKFVLDQVILEQYIPVDIFGHYYQFYIKGKLLYGQNFLPLESFLIRV